MNKIQYPLRTLFWECTLRCNAFCSFCGSRCGEVSTQELTTEEILSAFRNIAEKMDPSTIMINVTGGEPLLRKDLFTVMSRCSEMGYSWGMVTNGMLITPEIVDQMRQSGMKTVSVSLDGLEQTHETLRGVKGSFQKVLQGLNLLRDGAFLDHLQVTTVVSKRNINQLDDLYTLIKPLGLTSWRVALVDPIGRARDHDDLLPGKEDLKRYLDFLRSHRDDPQLRVITSCSHYFGEHTFFLRGENYVCRAGRTVASILANGDIFVCPNVPRRKELIQGNVLHDALPDIWQTGFQQFRDPNYRKGSTCDGCPDWTSCWGDSAHTWDYYRGEPIFCYRNFFPRQPEEILPLFRDILPKIKEETPDLTGIHVRYGWKNIVPVIFTPNAARELYHYFHWGQRHPQNLSELMAALIGHRLADGILVEFVSPVYLARRDTQEAVFTKESLASGQMEAAAINQTYHLCEPLRLLDTPCVLLGFVHSHPDNLELFLSEADVNLHRMLLPEDIPVSIVVNPQKRQLAAFLGNDCQMAEIRILTEQKTVPLWSITSKV